MQHPFQTSDAYFNKGRMYVRYNLFSVSLDYLYLSFLKILFVSKLNQLLSLYIWSTNCLTTKLLLSVCEHLRF